MKKGYEKKKKIFFTFYIKIWKSTIQLHIEQLFSFSLQQSWKMYGSAEEEKVENDSVAEVCQVYHCFGGLRLTILLPRVTAKT